VEILFPVETKELKEQLLEVLNYNLKDTMKAHIMQPDGTYEKVDKRGKILFCAQDAFCQEAVAEAKAAAGEDVHDSRVFIPERHVN
jgi:polyphosphate kinase